MSFLEEYNKLNKDSLLLINGILVLMTLLAVFYYVYNDYEMQKEVRDDCGWNPNDKVSCVCTKTAWDQYEGSLKLEDNITFEEWNP